MRIILFKIKKWIKDLKNNMLICCRDTFPHLRFNPVKISLKIKNGTK